MADLMRALVGFSTLRAAPTAALVAVLQDIVFQPDGLSLRVQTQAIREQAMLTLGAVVSPLSHPLSISRYVPFTHSYLVALSPVALPHSLLIATIWRSTANPAGRPAADLGPRPVTRHCWQPGRLALQLGARLQSPRSPLPH